MFCPENRLFVAVGRAADLPDQDRSVNIHDMHSERFTVIGMGSLGTALAVLLSRANARVEGLVDRDHHKALRRSLLAGGSVFPEPAEPVSRSTVVLLGVPQAELASVVQPNKRNIFCGAARESLPEGVELLDPLVLFEDENQALRALPGCRCVVSGAEDLADFLGFECLEYRPGYRRRLDRWAQSLSQAKEQVQDDWERQALDSLLRSI